MEHNRLGEEEISQKQRGSEPHLSLMDTEELLSLPVDQLLARINTNAEVGLTSREVESRIKIYGSNEIAKKEETRHYC